jgi:hypothetical protein
MRTDLQGVPCLFPRREKQCLYPTQNCNAFKVLHDFEIKLYITTYYMRHTKWAANGKVQKKVYSPWVFFKGSILFRVHYILISCTTTTVPYYYITTEDS